MPILLALTSALVYGVGDYCGGRAARASPAFVVSLVGQLATVGLTAAVVAILADPFPPGSAVAWGVAGGLSSMIGITAFYYALARGAMTVVAPLTAVVSALVPVGVGVGLGERPSALAVGGVVLAIVAVALVSGVGGRVERPTTGPIVLAALVSGTGFGLLFVFLDRPADDTGLWPLFIGQLSSLVVMAVVVAARRLPFPPPRARIGLMAISGVLAVVANVSYLIATRGGLLSLVAVITSMYPASTVVLATLLDEERLSGSQAVGLGLAVAALAMVASGS